MRVTTKSVISIAIILSAFFFTACTPPQRQHAVPREFTGQAEIPGMPGVRYLVRSDAIPELVHEGTESFYKEMAYLSRDGKTPDPLPSADFLALSGGGDSGAFGAGLLCGWSKEGSRPSFKLVTGISTGALLAPFAFLGAEYDPVLREVYTNYKPEDILKPRIILAALTDDAMADNAPLGRLTEKYITQDTLQAIAREYVKGRLLFIATTNLDARQSVIWNMTKIAASNHPDALGLFRKIMLASAAIPGAFPPSMFDVEVNGKPYQEMHVDGGATAQVFVYPPSYKLAEISKQHGVDRERRLYLIRNSRLDSDWAEVERQTLSIAGRAITSLIQTQGVGDLFRIYSITSRDGIDYNLAYIPKSFQVIHKEEFDTTYMRSLFQRGYDMALKGYPWEKQPPGF